MNAISKNKYAAPALDKGLDILEFLSASALPKSQAEIAAELGRSPNEIYRVLVNLEARNYLSRDTASGKYRLSLKLYTLSHTHSPIEQLRTAAYLPMSELAAKVGQSCHLSVPYEDSIMIVSQAKSLDPVCLSISEGAVLPLLTTVSGRLLLAHFSEEQRAKALQSSDHFNNEDKQQQNEILSTLAHIGETGFHHAGSDLTDGVTDFAAFIGQAESGIMAAIAISSLTTSLNRRRDSDSILQAVKSTAELINQRLGIELTQG